MKRSTMYEVIDKATKVGVAAAPVRSVEGEYAVFFPMASGKWVHWSRGKAMRQLRKLEQGDVLSEG